MRSPSNVLDSLANHSNENSYKYRRLYRNLYNPQFLYEAYQNIYAKTGNMSAGTDNKTIDGMSLERIDKLINKLKDCSYKPNPVKRVYIPKSNGQKRPLGVPSIDDKLVQEVIKRLLEAIYEGKFSDYSHGFRPNRSCHTALNQVQKDFKHVKWFVEGDIKSFFDNINHHILVNILKRHIEDQKFIDLIWKFLRAGYLENWMYHKTYSGTPQGGIISPILSNIYLNELDSYISEFQDKFNKGQKRQVKKEYSRAMVLKSQYSSNIRKNRETWEQAKLDKAFAKIRELKTKMDSMTSTDQFDANFKKMHYVRYADDFLIGVIGDKKDALQIKADLTIFLKEKLGLELSQEKTLITHSKSFARFLGYDIATDKTTKIMYRKDGVKTKKSGHIVMYLPKDKWVDKLKELGVINRETLRDNNMEWRGKSRTAMLYLDDLEILSIYNAEIRGMYNYYKLANNVSVLNKFHWIMENSFLKTLANKHKSSSKKVFAKNSQGGRFALEYETKRGKKTMFFHDKSFRRQKQINKNASVDTLEETIRIYGSRTSMVDRLKARECEICKANDVPLEMHHVRKLKDLKGKAKWEQLMIQRNRKTLALCINCHRKLHSGKLD